MSPFSSSENDRIDSIGESELIVRIKSWLGEACPDSPLGIGDDCSLLRLSPFETQLLTTADPVVYGRHFDDSLEPEQVALKLLRRNLSDIAAMGGAPKIATLSLALPGNLSLRWIRRFYEAIAEDALRFETRIVGGDTSSTNEYLGFFMTLNGVAIERALERRKAVLDSPIYVTGELGGSIRKKHYSFEPRLKEGQWLATRNSVTACMDLSDGLGKDAVELPSKGLGIRLMDELIPISGDAMELSEGNRMQAIERAINDGEDYELLFSIHPSSDTDRFESLWRENFSTKLSRIGYVCELSENEAPIAFENESLSLSFSGYEHFRTLD